MQNVFHVVLAIRELTRIRDLDFNRNGHFELIFDDETPVNFYRIDDQTIELCTILSEATRFLTAERIDRLMTANYLGHGTGGARLALDPRDRTLILCERLDVAGLDVPVLQARLERFIGYAKLWLSGQMDDLIEGGAAAKPAANDGEMIIRT